MIETWPKLSGTLQAALTDLAEALADAFEKVESLESVNTREDD